MADVAERRLPSSRFVFLLLILALVAAPVAAQSLLIEHATVIDGTGAAPIEDVSIAVADGRIEAIGPDLAAAPETTVVDASGKFVIPGLWDMHAHLQGLERSFRIAVANGITGIRDMYSGVAPAAYREWRTRPYAPRLAVAGLIDGPLRTPSPGALAVANPEEARAAFGLLASSGADFIKVYSSLSRESYLAIADEARRLGVPFAGHVPEAVSPAEAARVGQLSQEHLINILLACSTREDELRAERIAIMTDPSIPPGERARELGFPNPEGLFDTYSEEKAAELFATFVDYGVWHTPTLVLLKRFAEGGEAVRALPFMQDLDNEGLRAFQARAQALLERHLQLVGDMHRAGVQFLAGTDSSPATPVELGVSLHEELELLVAAGLSPMEALQTATRNPAFYFGILSLMGTVEKGKIADMVLLDANPLEDISNTRSIDSVVMRGVYFSRADLDRMLEEAAAN